MAKQDVIQDRELSWLPDWHLRPCAGGPRAGAGSRSSRPPRDLASCLRPLLRHPSYPNRAGRRTSCSRGSGRHRDRRALPQARSSEDYRPLRRPRELITWQPAWKRSSARTSRSRSSAAATRQPRRQCFCHARLLTFDIRVRGADLSANMSDYLVQRIARSPRITVHPFTEITALEGDRFLRSITWERRQQRSE